MFSKFPPKASIAHVESHATRFSTFPESLYYVRPQVSTTHVNSRNPDSPPILAFHITMADDTREPNTPRVPPAGATEPPSHVKTPNKVYEVFNAPPPSANALPEGSGQNTAGSREPVPTLGDAIKTVRLGDFKQVYMYPCVRESLMMGIGGGFAMGGIRALWGGKSLVTVETGRQDADQRQLRW